MLPKSINLFVAVATITSLVNSTTFEPLPRHHVNHSEANGHHHSHQHHHHHHHPHRHNTLDLADKSTPKRLLATHKIREKTAITTLPSSASIAALKSLSSTAAASAVASGGGTSFAAALSSVTAANDTTKPLKLMMVSTFDRAASSSSSSSYELSHTNINHHRWTPPPTMTNAFNSWNYNPMVNPSRGESIWPIGAVDTTMRRTTKTTVQPAVASKDRAHHHTKHAG